MSIEEILAYLNAARVRCTYKAVAEVLGGSPQSVAKTTLGKGARKPHGWSKPKRSNRRVTPLTRNILNLKKESAS